MQLSVDHELVGGSPKFGAPQISSTLSTFVQQSYPLIFATIIWLKKYDLLESPDTIMTTLDKKSCVICWKYRGLMLGIALILHLPSVNPSLQNPGRISK